MLTTHSACFTEFLMVLRYFGARHGACVPCTERSTVAVNWVRELFYDTIWREFTDGPAIVQAYGGGEIDVAMFGIVPSMIVIDRGLPARVTAANIREPTAILAHDDLRSM